MHDLIQAAIDEQMKKGRIVYNASIEQSDRLILNTLTADIEQSKR